MEIKDTNDFEDERMHLGSEPEEPIDTSTDVDSLRFLLASRPGPAFQTNKQLQRALRQPLPAPTYDEKLVLADGFDQKDLDEMYKHDAARFSGGEQRKLGTCHLARLLDLYLQQATVLARSFLKPDVDLLVLDEFSSNLDAVSEKKLFQQFLDDRAGRTSVFVTHRFHLAAKSDRILFFSKGKLIEQGTHRELMSNVKGKYRKM
jgi:ABC-type hemin transport system ATPase subunit